MARFPLGFVKCDARIVDDGNDSVSPGLGLVEGREERRLCSFFFCFSRLSHHQSPMKSCQMDIKDLGPV